MQKPLEIEIERLDGEKKNFRIRQFNAVDGLRFIAQYPALLAMSSTKAGNYALSEKILIEMFSFVDVVIGDQYIPLSTKDLINNHVDDFITLNKILREMIDFNTHFFTNGKLWDLATQIIRGIAESLIEMSKDSSDT